MRMKSTFHQRNSTYHALHSLESYLHFAPASVCPSSYLAVRVRTYIMNIAFMGRLLAFVLSSSFYTIAAALVAKLYEDRLWM